jgi:hypothetical protein
MEIVELDFWNYTRVILPCSNLPVLECGAHLPV